MDRSRAHRGRSILYHPTDAEAATDPNDWVGVITDVNVDGSVDAVVESPNVPTIGSALVSMTTADIAAFTDPPSAAEMALLRTFVNELKAKANTSATLVNQMRTAVSAMRKAGLTRGPAKGQYDFAPIQN